MTKEDQACKALLLQLMKQAVHEYLVGQKPDASEKERRTAREAERWIKSDRDDYITAFVPICWVAGLNPSYLRRKIEEVRDAL